MLAVRQANGREEMRQSERITLAAAHISQHMEAFHGHAGTDRTPEEYLSDYWYKYEEPGQIYINLCNDLGLEPKDI
jgi:hypothetical protein